MCCLYNVGRPQVQLGLCSSVQGLSNFHKLLLFFLNSVNYICVLPILIVVFKTCFHIYYSFCFLNSGLSLDIDKIIDYRYRTSCLFLAIIGTLNKHGFKKKLYWCLSRLFILLNILVLSLPWSCLIYWEVLSIDVETIQFWPFPRSL